jgi:ABC-type multidrug transport system ATPase subunit
MDPVIEVSHLSKHFGALKAVQDLSFTVNQGDIFGFLGQNGAGKSTTIRMLLTLIRPSSGDIRIFGKSLASHRTEILEQTGAIIESPDLYPYLSGLENLKIFSQLGGGKSTADHLFAVLEQVGLSGRSGDLVKTYSQGMKQRLGIAVALVRNPSLVILDEPTNGLDPQGIVEIRNLILRLNREEGKTFLVSSHLLSEVELIANRMLIIDKGQKIVEGEVRKLIDPEKVLLEVETVNAQLASEIMLHSSWAQNLKPTAAGRLLLDVGRQDIPAIAALLTGKGAGLLSMRPVNSLEAYFLSLTNRQTYVEDRSN